MSAVLVIGVDPAGNSCVREVLAHGADPSDALGARGWEAVELVDFDLVDGEVALVHRVQPCAPLPAPDLTPRQTIAPGRAATAVRNQRVSAYAVVESSRGLLLTEYSERTARPGTWGLPGGGLEPGEHPADGLLREVWEETGQTIDLDGPWQVVTDHWVGVAPNEVVEDFHAVRLIYRAHCSHPTDPVVHDVGGTTRSAHWQSRPALAGLEISPWSRALLTERAD